MSGMRQITDKTVFMTALIGSLIVVAIISFDSIWTSRQAATATDDAVSAVSSFYLETMATQRANTGESRYGFLSDDKMSDRLVSTVTLYDSTKRLFLAMPTPGLKLMGKNIRACFIQIDVQDIVDLLAPDEQDETFYAVYTSTGGNISGTELGPVIAEGNFLEATRGLVAQGAAEQCAIDFKEEMAGSLTFSSGGVEETVCYVPIEDPDWMFAVSIREGVITDQLRGISERSLAITRNQLVCTVAAVLVLSIVLLVETRIISRRRLAEEKATSSSRMRVS